MSILSDYRREERPVIEGALRCKIVEATEAVSKAGNPMLVMAVRPSGLHQLVRAYIVRNEYFNRHVTDVFDAFPSLGGSTKLEEWTGAMSAAMFSTDERGFIHVDYWIPSECAAHLPPYVESEEVS